jgi:hypothetical protein
VDVLAGHEPADPHGADELVSSPSVSAEVRRNSRTSPVTGFAMTSPALIIAVSVLFPCRRPPPARAMIRSTAWRRPGADDRLCVVQHPGPGQGSRPRRGRVAGRRRAGSPTPADVTSRAPVCHRGGRRLESRRARSTGGDGRARTQAGCRSRALVLAAAMACAAATAGTAGAAPVRPHLGVRRDAVRLPAGGAPGGRLQRPLRHRQRARTPRVPDGTTDRARRRRPAQREPDRPAAAVPERRTGGRERPDRPAMVNRG